MIEKTFDLTTFKKAQNAMIAKNDELWCDSSYTGRSSHNYTLEEVERIVNSSSLQSQQRLSREYYERDGLYKRILLYYATVLTYSGLLIPNPSFGKSLSTPHISKRYYAALEYVDKIDLKGIFTKITLRALIDGCYYGVIQTLDKHDLVLFDLPSSYCRVRYTDLQGHDIIEFNVQYFNSIVDQEMKEDTVNAYPKVISSHWRKFRRGKAASPWVALPVDIGVSFTISDKGRPLFLNVIPATMQYDDAIETDRERDLEEIRKIIVQKIPHLSDGQLLFEPEEALEIHAGTVGMMKGNRNISVLTTYTDVDAIVSKTTNETTSNSIEKMLNNVYSEAGASAQLFAPTGTQALNISIENDISLMMILGNKYSWFITQILNALFGNSNISFKYVILPISLYNRSEYIGDTLKLAQSGYSFLLPALAAGLNQRELVNIKMLENDVLNLSDILIPLSSSYTQTNNEVGAPEKAPEEKSDKTIQNENAIDAQGGSN